MSTNDDFLTHLHAGIGLSRRRDHSSVYHPSQRQTLFGMTRKGFFPLMCSVLCCAPAGSSGQPCAICISHGWNAPSPAATDGQSWTTMGVSTPSMAASCPATSHGCSSPKTLILGVPLLLPITLSFRGTTGPQGSSMGAGWAPIPNIRAPPSAVQPFPPPAWARGGGKRGEKEEN